MAAQEKQRRREQLRQILARVGPDSAAIADEAREPSGGQASGELSSVPTHLGDRGTDEFNEEVTSALAENEQYIVQEIRDALERLDVGAYGKCENCGQPISKARLDVRPYARYCIQCEERLDATPRSTTDAQI